MSTIQPVRVVFEKGDYIIHQGDRRSDNAFLIQSGKVQVLAIKNGKKYHIAYAGPNDIIGEMALVDDSPRSASVVALQPTVCASMDRSTFKRALEASNPFVVALLRVITQRYRGMLNDIYSESK